MSKETMQRSEREYDLQTVKATIKTFLNDIDDCVDFLDKLRYATRDISMLYGYHKYEAFYETNMTDLYVAYDLLNRELLSDKNISKLYYANKTDDIIKELNIFSNLLKDLVNQLKKGVYGKNVSDAYLQRYHNKMSNLSKPYNHRKPQDTKEAIFRSVLALAAAAGVFTGSSFYKAVNKGPATLEYNIDIDGNIESVNHHYPIDKSDQVIEIDEYISNEEDGYSIKKVYYLDSGSDIINSAEALSQIDLSYFEPSEIKIVNKTPSGRTYHVLKENNDEIVKYDEADVVGKCIYAGLASMIGIGVTFLLSIYPFAELTYDYNYSLTDVIEEYFRYIISLAKYKQQLRKLKEEHDKIEKAQNEYDKYINTICNRIEKTIIQVVDRLSIYETSKTYKIEKEAREKQEEHIQATEEEKNKKEELFNNIKTLIKTLTENVDKLDDEEMESKVLHSIPVTEEILFEQSGNHLIIRLMFIPLLPYLDLRLITFDNVDVRYIDFSNTNAVVNLKNVYNKDASYSTFNDSNLLDWIDYRDVIMIGVKIKKNPTVLTPKIKAIMEEETALKR